MAPLDLVPRWNPAGTRLLLGLLAVLLLMTAVALALRARARTDGQSRFARDFGARTLGWWLIIAVYIPGLVAGGGVLAGLFAVITLLAWREFTGLDPAAAWRGRDWLWTVPVAGLLAAATAGWVPGPAWWPAAAGGGAVLLAAAGPGWAARARWRLAGFVYGVLVVGLGPLVVRRFGPESILFISVVVPSGDIAQYLTGKLCGRRLLAPSLSPHKTWEGFLGGVAVSALLGAALAPWVHAAPGAGLLIGAGLAVAGTAGGLLMSAAKRRHGAKDFGGLLPGQGGVLDRFDSLGAAFAAAWVLLPAAG